MKRILSLLLSLVLSFALLPSAVLAAGEVWDGSVDISWYDPAKSEYYLSTPAQLAGLAALVNGMADPAAPKITGDRSYLKSIRVDNVMLVGAGGGNVFDTVYTSDIDFAGKTVYLTADLDMGGVYDAVSGIWSGPNWTPIGGKFPMKPQEAEGDCLTIDTRFNGVLDGQGHTISHLYCDRYAEKGFPYSMAVGVVGFLGGACDNNTGITADFSDGWQPAVRNLVLASGSILGRRMVGGIVGRVGETENGVVVENCANRASVRSTDSKGVGGIVGSAWGKGCIRNCYNTGHISTIYTCPAGGILGTNEGMDVYNCYNVGTIDTNGVSYGRAIGSHDSGSYTVANCYYLSGCDDDASANGYYKGVSKRISVSCHALSANEITDASFLAKINANGAVFAADERKINGGYPVLWFENGGAQENCTVTAESPQHGALALSVTGGTPRGTTISMTAEPEAGYLLSYFTVNGKPIAGGFFAATQDVSVGAVFKKVRTASLTWEESDAYYLAVRRTGWRYEPDGTMVSVTNEPIHSGDMVLEGNILTLLTHEYTDAVPADDALEYRSGVIYTVGGAEKNVDGTYTVTGGSAVTITGTRNTRGKSWSSCADKSWYTGKQNTYTLTTAEQLAGLAVLVNGGTDFSGMTVRLGSDISLTHGGTDGASRIWTVIGTSMGRAFRGTFDGQDHVITGLRAESAGSYCALFGCAVGASIKDLTVCGTSSGSAAASYAAGLVAYADGCAIENCDSYVTVTAAGTHAGGLAAYIANGTNVKSCVSYGAVTGASGVGGLIGVSYSGEDCIEECASFGNVTSTRSGTYGTGGLLGRLAGTLTRSAAYGAVVSADRYTGGLAGYTTARNKTEITLCRAVGAVSSSNTDARVSTGGLVGYAQNLRYGGCESVEGVLPQLGRTGTVQEITASGEIPSFTPVPEPEDSAVDAPPQNGAAKPQRPAMVENNAVTVSGTYYIPWFSTGELTVGDGLTVTLCGAYGPFDGLRIIVGHGTALTLEDVSLSGETTLLTMQSGKLTLAGENVLDGRSDAPGDPDPTVRILGDLTINGEGRLSVTARVNNACVLASAGIRILQTSGTLSVFKTDKLGFAGGAFCANGAQVEIAGGTFAGRTDSDNVAVLSADTIRVSGGNVRVESEKSPAALLGKVTLENAVVSARSHTGNSAKFSTGYENAAALGTSVSQKGVTWKALLPFTDVHAEDGFYDDVAYCVEQGWLKGVSGESFDPNGSMTRAMFVTALYRAAGSPTVTGNTPFTDLKAEWYRGAVVWAVQTGIVQGTSKTTFSPDAPLTVEQAAALMQRYLGGEVPRELMLPAGAGAVSQWARGSVKWAYDARLLTVTELTEPSGEASRMLLAQILRRSAQ